MLDLVVGHGSTDRARVAEHHATKTKRMAHAQAGELVAHLCQR